MAEGGTLYWVTGLGVTFDSRAKNTLAELEKAGLNVAAMIIIAPGAFAGSMIEGAVIALRRGVQKKFVGALRDLETALPMAAAFLDGPTKKAARVGFGWISATIEPLPILNKHACSKTSHLRDGMS